MNKKIKTEIAIVIILVIAVVVVGTVWLAEKKQDKELSSASNQVSNIKERRAEEDKLSQGSANEEFLSETAGIVEKELPKTVDYAIKNLKMTPLTPRVNEAVTVTFDLYNNGQGDLPGSGYDFTLSGANMIPENSKYTCGESVIIKSGTSCGVAKKISYSTAGKYIISVMADSKQIYAETNENNNVASLDFRTKPDVEVMRPNGGESLKVGETYKIKWSVENDNVSRIQLAIFNSSANGVVNISGYLDAKDEVYEWTVPSFDNLPGLGGKDYKLRIINAETNETVDESSSKFSIDSK